MGQTVGSFEQDFKSMFWHVEIIIVIILNLYSMLDNGHTLRPIDDSKKVSCITNKGNHMNSIEKYYTYQTKKNTGKQINDKTTVYENKIYDLLVCPETSQMVLSSLTNTTNTYSSTSSTVPI